MTKTSLGDMGGGRFLLLLADKKEGRRGRREGRTGPEEQPREKGRSPMGQSGERAPGLKPQP